MELLIGLFFAPIGYVFTRILMEDALIGYNRLIANLPDWLYKPLGGCGACFTGQLTLWGLLPFFRMDYLSIILYFGIVAINIIIVKILIYAEKD
jgi:hypothetical protein